MTFEESSGKRRRGGWRLRKVLEERRSALGFTGVAFVGTLVCYAYFSSNNASEMAMVVLALGGILTLAGVFRVAWSFVQAWFERQFSPEVKHLVRTANLVVAVGFFIWIVVL